MFSISAECRPLYRPRYLPIVGRYVDHHSADISVNALVDTSTDTLQSTYRPTLDRYVDRHIGRHSANMSADTSVECQSICRPRCRPRGAQNTHNPLFIRLIFQNVFSFRIVETSSFNTYNKRSILMKQKFGTNLVTSFSHKKIENSKNTIFLNDEFYISAKVQVASIKNKKDE